MPYIQVKTSNVFGFMPDLAPGTLTRVTPYIVSSSEGAINAGDVVILSSITGSAAMAICRGIGTGVWSTGILGVAAHTMLSDQGSTAVNLTNLTSGILLVHDDPNIQFVVSDQASSAGGFLLSSQIGTVVSVLATGGLGSTGAFQSGSANSRSNQVIGGAYTTAAAGPFKLTGLHPIDHATSSGIGRKWLVEMQTAAMENGLITVTT